MVKERGTFKTSDENPNGDHYSCESCHDQHYMIEPGLPINNGYPSETAYNNGKPIDYGKPCPHCNGGRADGNESELPGNYYCSARSDFKWDVYEKDTDRKVITKILTIADDFWNNFRDWEEKSKGLYFWSETPGSGKTLLSACILNAARARHHVMIKYVRSPDYIDMCLERSKSDNAAEHIRQYKTTDILLLDDIGSEDTTPKMQKLNSKFLFSLLDFRYSSGKPTIITSNAAFDELNLEQRVKDRINAMCISLHFPEISIRKQKADRENAEFISERLKKYQQPVTN